MQNPLREAFGPAWLCLGTDEAGQALAAGRAEAAQVAILRAGG